MFPIVPSILLADRGPLRCLGLLESKTVFAMPECLSAPSLLSHCSLAIARRCWGGPKALQGDLGAKAPECFV